jgi:acid phosphatase type 7
MRNVFTHRWIKQAAVVLLLAIVVPAGCLLESNLEIAPQATQPPDSFLLSWQRDPSTTMTVDWHSSPGTYAALEFRRLGDEGWMPTEGDRVGVPGTNRSFRRTELIGLLPNQRYEFRFNGEPPVYQFRTMPARLTRPIRFVTGGDMLHRVDWMRNTASSVMKTDGADELDFAVIGGDLAYADGEARKVGRWYDYFKVWTEEMITSDNRVIPHIAAIGNHELLEGFIHKYAPAEYTHPDFVRRHAPYFSTFIAFPGPDAYGVLDFGDYLSLFLLDSGHASFIGGEQTSWLRRELHQRGDMRHIIPVYHVPAWPSVRKFNDFSITQVRNYWVPLFEEHDVRLAFENHDHAYKRTHPIRNGQIDPSGIHYIGDGAWGVRTRAPRRDDEGRLPWYIAEADSLRHFIMGKIDGDHIRLEMYDEDGRHIDRVTVAGHRIPIASE